MWLKCLEKNNKMWISTILLLFLQVELLVEWSNPAILNLRYPYPWGYVSTSKGYTKGQIYWYFFIRGYANTKRLRTPDESGSTARNATAQISTARHFFPKCHLLDTKSINCSTDKSMPYVYHISFLSSWHNFCDSKK